MVEIRMQGRPDGSHVWFDPIGVRVEPGQTVRWTNLDPGNSHTSTAYHPSIADRPLRMPEAAKPWNSDYLLPDESFSAALSEPGVYDYYCQPHEHAGMVGRIVVGTPHSWNEAVNKSERDRSLPTVAIDAFPSVEEILSKGIVRRA
jgi:plastocyanin